MKSHRPSLHLNCPNCHAAIEVLPEVSYAFLTCSSCGSRIAPSDEVTASYSPTVQGRIDEYELLEFLGGGTFGEVWKARDTILNKLVAIKLPRERNYARQAIDLFLREARIMATLQHPNIVRVIRVIHREDLTAIVMEYVQGTTLAARLENFPFDDPRKAVEFWIKVVRAVDHAHESGVVHRDLKAGNILLDERREPLVSDFGLAKYDSAEFTLSGDNAVLGNFAHMAPEQAAGKSADADRRSDIYSLGSILYQLLAHRAAFIGGTRTLSDLKQNDDPLPPSRYNPRVSRDLDTICLHAMQRDPALRYQTAGALADDLQRYLDRRPIVARRTPVWERAVRWAQRNRALAGMSFVAAVLAAVAVGLSLTGRQSPAEPEPELVKVLLTTTPSNAKVYLHQLNPTTGEPWGTSESRFEGASPLAVRVPVGDYLVVAVAEDGKRFHEVFRRAPSASDELSVYRHRRWKMLPDGTAELPTIEIPQLDSAEDMVRFSGSDDFTIGGEQVPACPPFQRQIPGFYLDRRELSVQVVASLLPSFRGKARSSAGETETPEEAVAAMLSWDEAVFVAELLGKRLPDEFEFEFAAKSLERGSGGDAPIGLKSSASTMESGSDARRASGSSETLNLLTSVAEWTSSRPTVYPKYRNPSTTSSIDFLRERIVRGADQMPPDSPAAKGAGQPANPSSRISFPINTWRSDIGVRCARSVRPRVSAADFGRER